MREVARTRCILPMHFYNIEALKCGGKLKHVKINNKYHQDCKKEYAYLHYILKVHVKFQKDRLKTIDVARSRCIFAILLWYNGSKMSKFKM